MTSVRDGWRLALGMLTAVRVAMPSRVDREVARDAMLLAPLAAAPLALGVLLVGLVGLALDLPPLVSGLLAVAVLVLGTRAFHVDGLSDTADGLTASLDRERALAAMHTSTSGPAGGATVVLVLGVQAAALASMVTTWRGVVAAAVAVCLSRFALWLTCREGVPSAQAGGLGATYAGTVPTGLAVAAWLVVALVLTRLATWTGDAWWRGPLAAALGAVVVLLLVRRAVARLGGTSGDVHGAAIELGLAALLVGLA